MQQTLNGRSKTGTGTGQVVQGFRVQLLEAEIAVYGIGAVVQVDLSALAAFQIDQNVNDGAAGSDFPHVEGPLVALQKQLAQHFAGGGEEIHQEFPGIAAVRLRGVYPGKHLHIGTGDVPPGAGRGETVLPLGQILALDTGLQRQTRRAELAGGIYAVGVDTGGAAGGVHHVFAPNQQIAVFRRLRLRVQAEKTQHPFSVADDLDYLGVVQHGDALGGDRRFQLFRHLLAGVGADAGGTAAGVMVCFVADVFAVAVPGEGNPQLCQLEKALGGQCGLAKGNVAVHTLAVKQRFGHFPDAVGVAPGQGQLVVGLLVTAGIPAGAGGALFRNQKNILLAVLP